MTCPLISIIVPIYNVERYLRKCVDSILVQTYANIEIILVDDGSPDGCPGICDEYAEKDSRVVVIHQQNAGVSAARNAGLDAAKGEYIGFVDSDDWIESDMVEVLYHVITASGADIADSSNCTGDCKPARANIDEAVTFSSMEAVMKMLYGQWDLFYVWRKLFAREVVKDIRFNLSSEIGDDILFVTKAIINSRKISHINYQCYHYIIREDSGSHAFNDSFWTVLNMTELFWDVIRRYDSKLSVLAAKNLLEHDIRLSQTTELKGKFSEYAHEKVTEHIRKYKNKDSWKLLAFKNKCWIRLLLLGRGPFIAARKIWRSIS